MILSVFILQMNLVISLQLATAAKWGVGLPSKFVVFNIFQIISIQSHFQSSQNRNSKPLFLFEIPSMGKSRRFQLLNLHRDDFPMIFPLFFPMCIS